MKGDIVERWLLLTASFIFALLTHLDCNIALQCYYNEAHHEKGVMDSVGDTIKGVVYS